MTTRTDIRPPSPVDRLEMEISRLPAAVCPLVHSFTPGIYVRQIVIPAGTLLTSMEHKTEHPFIVISGTIEVLSDFENEIYIVPHMIPRVRMLASMWNCTAPAFTLVAMRSKSSSSWSSACTPPAVVTA